MDDIRTQHRAALRDMIGAFVRISDLARRAGVDEDEISIQHGMFFDGKVAAQRRARRGRVLRGGSNAHQSQPRVREDESTSNQRHWQHPVIYMSRRTTVEIWRMMYGAEPDLVGDLRFGQSQIPVLFDDGMELGEARIEEDPAAREAVTA